MMWSRSIPIGGVELYRTTAVASVSDDVFQWHGDLRHREESLDRTVLKFCCPPRRFRFAHKPSVSSLLIGSH